MKLKEMKKLVAELNAASDAYYNHEETLMDNDEFDIKLKHLTDLEKELNIVLSNSPTVNVGAPVLKEIKTVKMEQKPMLSLEKVHSTKEIIDFAKGKPLVCSVKCDGMSTRLVYKDGKLVSANSRGNGTEGSDLTEHVKHFLNVPLTINAKGTYIVDGESIIKDKDFELVNSKLTNKLKNSRNAVAGTLASLDTSVVDERRVSFIAWDVIEGSECKDFNGRLYEVSCLGFEVVPYEFIENANENIFQTKINTMFEISKLKGIPNDGVVFRLNDIKFGDSLGSTAHHFLNAVAYKAAQEEYETTLINVEYTMGKTGSLCPVAIFEPVEIDGTTIEKCSMHNISVMRDQLGVVHKGQKVFVFKANQIIPQISYADQTDVDFELSLGKNLLVPPSKCPICGAHTEIRKDNDTEVLYCTSNYCSGKLLGKLKAFVSKQAMDIDGLSEATLDLLLKKELVGSYKDIYHLHEYKTELSNLPRMGAKSVKKLLDAIETSRKTTLDRFLVSLSIPLIGKSTAKDISTYCEGDIDNFIFIVNNTVLEFASIDGVGMTVVDSLIDWWDINSESVFELLEELEIEVPVEKTESSAEKILGGMTFVVTGSVYHFKNRGELQSKIESLGGKVVGSVSKSTSVLLNNDTESNSSKNVKAKSLGIPIWSEEDFLKHIETK